MITKIYSLVEVIDGQPCITNYRKLKPALAAFKKICKEKIDGDYVDPIDSTKEVAEAMKNRELNQGIDYCVMLQTTDLRG